MKKAVLGAVLAGMMAMAGCDRVEKAARDLAGDNDRAATASSSSTVRFQSRDQAVSSSSDTGHDHVQAPPPAFKITDPSDVEVGTWHMEMNAACAAGKAEHIAHFDLNGDGLPDTVCWRTIRSKDHGNFVDVAARVKIGDREQYAYMLLPARSDQQVALCSVDHVTVKQTLWPQGDLARKGWSQDQRISLTVDDGDCDPVWLFWPKDGSGDEVDFDFRRN